MFNKNMMAAVAAMGAVMIGQIERHIDRAKDMSIGALTGPKIINENGLPRVKRSLRTVATAKREAGKKRNQLRHKKAVRRAKSK